MSSRLKFLSDAHETVQKDIALTQRVTEKTAVDVAKAEENKLDQVTNFQRWFIVSDDNSLLDVLVLGPLCG